jgi:hypothetical protein
MMARASYTIGRMWARPFRRSLMEWGFDYTEDKGWLDSQFIVTGDHAKLALFGREFRKWVERTAVE